MLSVAEWIRRKPIVTLVVFGLFAVSANFVSSPWWEGPLLKVAPEWPAPSGAFVERAEQKDREVEQEVAKVDLKATSESPKTPSSDRKSSRPSAGAAAASSHTSEAAPSGDTSESDGDDEGTPTETASEDSSRRAPRRPSSSDLRLHRKMAGLAEKLDQPPVSLERPCRRWVSEWRSRGWQPLCADRAMDDFFEKLRAVALGRAERPVRLSQFGDSLVAGDTLTGELRRLLQEQFGDGGFGYLHVGEATRHFGTAHLTTDYSGGWKRSDVVHDPHTGVPMGFGGVAFEPRGGPSVGVYPHDEGTGRAYDRVGILFYRRTREHRLRLAVGGGSETVDLSGEPETNALHWIDVEPGPHDLRVGGFDRGAVWYGIVLERRGPGVVVDNLGLSSGRAPRLKYADADQWRAQIGERGPDLLSFAYGVNSAGRNKAADSWLEQYASDYATVLRRASRAGDSRSCLVVSLLTRGGMEGDEVVVFDSVEPLVEYQRRASRRAECGFWNAYRAMGGADGADHWYHNTPQLLGSDFAHPTGAGYKKLANLFYASLVEAFVDYLDERIRRHSLPRRRIGDARTEFRAPPRRADAVDP